MKKTQNMLWVEGFNLLLEKKFHKAEAILLKALDAKDDNPIDRHFTYSHLIDLYYRLRNERSDALQKCIEYCLLDIDSLPDYFDYDRETEWQGYLQSKKIHEDIGYEFDREFSHANPHCSSLSRLAIIYEKNGEYEKAINVCDKAFALDQSDGTKGGFEARKSRLQKRLWINNS